jgi:carbonic anhydrase
MASLNDPDTTFATVLNCMDGRVQLPVHAAVQEAFGVSCVDTITAPGIVALLADALDTEAGGAVMECVEISVAKHGSRGIAVVAHADCAGNPTSDAEQQHQLARAVAAVAERYPRCRVLGYWVGLDGRVVRR